MVLFCDMLSQFDKVLEALNGSGGKVGGRNAGNVADAFRERSIRQYTFTYLAFKIMMSSLVAF